MFEAYASILTGAARALPVVTIVPAFGLRALPAPARGVVAIALGLAIAPAMPSLEAGPPGVVPRWLEQVLLGLPIALAAAIPLWAATMAGGVADTLRGGGDDGSSPVVEGKAGRFGILFAMFASVVFLGTGGPARVATALATATADARPLAASAAAITAGIELAVAIAGPLLVAAVVLEVFSALVARAAAPAQIQALVAPLRSLGILAVTALVLERMSALIAIASRSAP